VVFDGDTGDYTSGGLLEAASGGSISFLAQENIEIAGMVGRVYESGGLPVVDVSRVNITAEGAVFISYLVNAADQVTINAYDVFLIAEDQPVVLDGVVVARAAGSSVSVNAEHDVFVYDSSTQHRTLIASHELVEVAAANVYVYGWVWTVSDTSSIVLSSVDDIVVEGTITSPNTIALYAGERDANGDFTYQTITYINDDLEEVTEVRGGITISKAGLIRAEGRSSAGSDSLTLAAANRVEILADASAGTGSTRVAPPYIVSDTEIIPRVHHGI
jgi:hypothetical protein